MENTNTSPKKASEILLDLDSKIDLIINMMRSIDLNHKVLSNKINNLFDSFDKISKRFDSLQLGSTPKMGSIEATHNVPLNKISQLSNDNERNIFISSEESLLLQTVPNGVRRTSRPDNSTENVTVQKKPEAEIIVPENITNKIEVKTDNQHINKRNNSSIQVIQRVVDSNGKSVFLANVEITDSSNKLFSKTRTNGAGKWMASLEVGMYKITLRKLDSITKEKTEIVQKINVVGDKPVLELPVLTIKN